MLKGYFKLIVRLSILCSLLAVAVMMSSPGSVLAQFSPCKQCEISCVGERSACLHSCQGTAAQCDLACNPNGNTCAEQCTAEGVCP
jgi:hypothetical protein